MSAGFWIVAALLTLAALAFVLPPLLRRGTAGGDDDAERRHALERAHATGVLTEAEYRAKRDALAPAAAGASPAPARFPALLLALVLPLAAWGLYSMVGEPRALVPGATAPVAGAPTAGPAPIDGDTPSLEQATDGLAQRMRETPDDLGGWMLLGRAYKSMQRFDAAREALANAYRLAPGDADVMVEYAEALTLASDSRRIEGEASRLLDAALVVQPTHARALWLTGIRAYQGGEFAQAAATWETLRDSLPAEDPVRGSLEERIADARAQAGLPVAAAPAAQAAAPTAQADAAPGTDAAGSTGLTVQVDIAPGLKQRLGASDVLFVFARAPEGSRMPLAIQRLQASQLPVTVTLDDSTSMMPQLKLSTLPEVVVGARISKSGQAVPQPGDLEALSDPVRSNRSEPVNLVIDRVVE